MTAESASGLALVPAIPLPALDPGHKQTRAAIRRCCTAWQRSYDAYLEGTKGSRMDRAFAAHHAGPAYCKAMPPLAGQENIRDFIACAAHGILIGAIPQKMGNQLLYAARVALASLRHETSG
ncbi:MAG: hypothetical protein ABSC48_17405 [Terracidiphilus sp.]|jgi:hypothetical protein